MGLTLAVDPEQECLYQDMVVICDSERSWLVESRTVTEARGLCPWQKANSSLAGCILSHMLQ
jgi:hypothetical protein